MSSTTIVSLGYNSGELQSLLGVSDYPKAFKDILVEVYSTDNISLIKEKVLNLLIEKKADVNSGFSLEEIRLALCNAIFNANIGEPQLNLMKCKSFDLYQFFLHSSGSGINRIANDLLVKFIVMDILVKATNIGLDINIEIK